MNRLHAIELGPKSALEEKFFRGSAIELAQELQANLAGFDEATQEQMAPEAVKALGDPHELLGGSDVYVHSRGAVIAATGMGDIEALYHGTYFADVYMASTFARFVYLKSTLARGLCLMMVETDILASASNPEMEGEHLPTGMYVPVHSVESAFAA